MQSVEMKSVDGCLIDSCGRKMRSGISMFLSGIHSAAEYVPRRDIQGILRIVI